MNIMYKSILLFFILISIHSNCEMYIDSRVMPIQFGQQDTLRATSMGASEDPQRDLANQLEMAKLIAKYNVPTTIEDINFDMFRAYDYRTEGGEILPRIAFRMGIVWGQMALERAKQLGIKDKRTCLFARDCRDLNPEIKEAIIAGIRYVGLNVIDISLTENNEEHPNCVSNFSQAILKYKKDILMTIFETASHKTGEGVSGAKVTILGESSEVVSLTPLEIKVASSERLKRLVEHPEEITSARAEKFGSIAVGSSDEETVRTAVLISKLAAGSVTAKNAGIDVYNYERGLRQDSDNFLDVLGQWEAKADTTLKPLAGMKVVVDGANTPSGELMARTYEQLGATVYRLACDVKPLKGEHRADPARPKNLEPLKKEIERVEADFGDSFDLDGDRVAIVTKNEKGEYIDFHPDNMIAALLPFLFEHCGYDPKKLKLAVVSDALSTAQVRDVCEKYGVEHYQTDAGYVFLKAKVRELESQGYLVPIYGERAGHFWLSATGVIEDPIAIAALYATMAAEYKREHAASRNPLVDATKAVERIALYKTSERSQPPLHSNLLRLLTNTEANDTGWTYESIEKVPQKIVDLGKDYCIRRIQEDFAPGTTFNTLLGTLTVSNVVTYQDTPEEGGLYRYADINFNLNGKRAGRFVFRASANDVSFVFVFEARAWERENLDSPALKQRYDLIGGIVFDWLERNQYGSVAGSEVKDYTNKSATEAVLARYRSPGIDELTTPAAKGLAAEVKAWNRRFEQYIDGNMESYADAIRKVSRKTAREVVVPLMEKQLHSSNSIAFQEAIDTLVKLAKAKKVDPEHVKQILVNALRSNLGGMLMGNATHALSDIFGQRAIPIFQEIIADPSFSARAKIDALYGINNLQRQGPYKQVEPRYATASLSDREEDSLYAQMSKKYGYMYPMVVVDKKVKGPAIPWHYFFNEGKLKWEILGRLLAKSIGMDNMCELKVIDVAKQLNDLDGRLLADFSNNGKCMQIGLVRYAQTYTKEELANMQSGLEELIVFYTWLRDADHKFIDGVDNPFSQFAAGHGVNTFTAESKGKTRYLTYDTEVTQDTWRRRAKVEDFEKALFNPGADGNPAGWAPVLNRRLNPGRIIAAVERIEQIKDKQLEQMLERSGYGTVEIAQMRDYLARFRDNLRKDLAQILENNGQTKAAARLSPPVKIAKPAAPRKATSRGEGLQASEALSQIERITIDIGSAA